MEGKVAKKNRITEGGAFGQLPLFFLPILFGTSFQQLYNTADAMVMDRFMGKQALAVVGGSTNTLISLLMGFFAGLSSGATAAISQFYGAGKVDKVHWVVHTSIAFSVIGGIIFMIAGLVGSSWVLEAMKTSEDIMGHAVIHIRIYFLGIVVNPVYNTGAGILRTAGGSRRPLYFLIASCFTNITLDALLVAVLRMGVAGAALAVITSQLLGTVLAVRALTKMDDMYRLEWKKVRTDQRMLQRIMRIGIPAGVRSVMYNIFNVIVQTGVSTLETDNVATRATYDKVDDLYWMTVDAPGISATTFMRQNFGVGRLDRVRKGAGACVVVGVVPTASMGAVLYNGDHLPAELLTTDLQVQAISTDLLHFMVPTFTTYIAIEILSDTLRGAGDAWMSLVITGIDVCAVRVLWIMLALLHYYTIIGVTFCYPLTWSPIMTVFVVYCYFLSSLRR